MKGFKNARTALIAASIVFAAASLAAQTQAALPQPRTVRILFDNRACAAGTKAAWGFSCLVAGGDTPILFDAGADRKILERNMKALGIDPLSFGAIVVSHMHDDHIGGMGSAFRDDSGVSVSIPQAWPFGKASARLKAASAVTARSGPLPGFPGAYLIGPMGKPTVEQALALDTPSGIVLITGCAHPGVVALVEAAEAYVGRDVYAVMGGFHLLDKNETDVKRIIAELKALGVKICCPGHCTGDAAIALFREAFGDGFIELGVGTEIRFD